jgi:hypothetical protein
MITRTVPTMAEAKALPIRWREADVLIIVARLLKWHVNLCVPHVYLSPSNREMDLAVVTPTRRLWAVEIKVSLADWKRDLNKHAYPARSCPSRFYYAVPEHLVSWTSDPRCERRMLPQLPDWVPESAGIIWLANDRATITVDTGWVQVSDTPTTLHAYRAAKTIHRNALTEAQYLELLRKLGHAYWRHVAPIDASMPGEIESNP